MTHIIQPFAKAMTAIAAVLALSATPSFAQEVGTPPDPATDATTQPTTADPLAPENASQAPATDTAVPPASKPKVETRTTATQRAKPSASASASRSTAQRTSAAAPAATTAASAVKIAPPAPLPAEPQPPVAAEPAPLAIAQPAPVSDTPDTLSDLMADDMLPIAGAGALGLIALGGVGIAVRRRKRRREDAEIEARQQALAMAEAGPTPAPEPAAQPTLELDRAAEVRPGPVFNRARAPVHDPVPDRNAPVTSLPDGFDLSRFGPHMQAAYRGPTADNPSLSLKYRLRRAAFLDQQDRRMAAQTEVKHAAKMPAKAPARGDWESRSDADFMFRRASKPVRSPVEPQS